jgi:hypothetical protein
MERKKKKKRRKKKKKEKALFVVKINYKKRLFFSEA